MGGLQLDFATPAPDLAPYVSAFYRFVADVPWFEDVERADRAQLRFLLDGGPADYLFDTGKVRAPCCHLIGPTCGATRSCAAGPFRLFGLGLTAAGWGAMVDLDASSVRGTVIDADALFGPPLATIAARLREVRDVGEMVAIVEPFLQMLVVRHHDAMLAFAAAVDAWLASGPAPDLDTLRMVTGLSSRQVERRCNRLYGAPPKLLARKHRALRAAAALVAGGATSDPAVIDGFYDQSHMIREIKQFAGATPRSLCINPGPLARLTSRRHSDSPGAASPRRCPDVIRG